MPSVNFVLPHWLYWSGLVIFPLVAMYMARRPQPPRGSRSLGIAYFIWLVGGMFGFHRLYLKNRWGFLYWPLFALILYANGIQREARVAYSDAVAAVQGIEGATARNESRIRKSEDIIERARTKLAELPAGEESESARARQERKIAKAEKAIAGAREKLAALAREAEELKPRLEAAAAERQRWSDIAWWAFIAIAAFMAVDFFLIPSMLKSALRKLEREPPDEIERELLKDDKVYVGTGLAGVIDRISLFTGEFVAYWSVIAVFAYYYEVMVRYVFNSPTNWAHEAMFLMFGMQYLIAGAYAMLTESHVRVDIFYANFSPRAKAIVDLMTSVFFFIFAFTLLWTGWIFASDSIHQNEVSFTEWGIQYWPVKITIVIGGGLLILQGISEVMKDIATVLNPERRAENGA